jgi:hypothetical protein
VVLPCLLEAEYPRSSRTFQALGLQGKIGFIFGSFSVISKSEPHARVALNGLIRSQIVFCVLFVPEFEDRTLEELYLLYDARIPARTCATYDITQL